MIRKSLCLASMCSLLLVSGASCASSVSTLDLSGIGEIGKPGQTDRRSYDLSAKPSRELTPQEQMQHNANRNALMKNWKIDFSWDPVSYTGKYRHAGGTRAVVMRLVGSGTDVNPEKSVSLELTKALAGKFKADLSTLKIYSPEMASFDVKLVADRPMSAENKMRVFVRKEKAGDPLTLIHVMGDVSREDLDYVVEDFFLKIQSTIATGGARQDQSPADAEKQTPSGDDKNTGPAPETGKDGTATH
ncbi:MAG: hypothetical protein IJ523_00795 [Succinivibrionaceae bacterium]|nr:hypothetical protein [Succinivibrionaceae bacterium]